MPCAQLASCLSNHSFDPSQGYPPSALSVLLCCLPQGTWEEHCHSHIFMIARTISGPSSELNTHESTGQLDILLIFLSQRHS